MDRVDRERIPAQREKLLPRRLPVLLRKRRAQVEAARGPSRTLEALGELGMSRRVLVLEHQLEHRDHLRARIRSNLGIVRDHDRSKRCEEILPLLELQTVERLAAPREHDLADGRRQAFDKMQQYRVGASIRQQFPYSLRIELRRSRPQESIAVALRPKYNTFMTRMRSPRTVTYRASHAAELFMLVALWGRSRSRRFARERRTRFRRGSSNLGIPVQR